MRCASDRGIVHSKSCFTQCRGRLRHAPPRECMVTRTGHTMRAPVFRARMVLTVCVATRCGRGIV
eukprot:181522-Lingulodinium_polyedra.AAC.1